MKVPKHLSEYTYIDIIRTMKFSDVIDAKKVASEMRQFVTSPADKFPVSREYTFLKILEKYNFSENLKKLLLKEVKEEFVSDEYYNCYIPARYDVFADTVIDQVFQTIQYNLRDMQTIKYTAAGDESYPIFTILENKVLNEFNLRPGPNGLFSLPLTWVMKPICRRCGELLIKTDNDFLPKSYIVPMLKELQEKGEIFEFVRSTGKYICLDCFNKTLSKTPKLVKVGYTVRYMRMEHYEAIVARLEEINTILTEENIAIADMDTIVEKFEEEINTLLRGLKRICFDCGRISMYHKDTNRLSGTWTSIKKRFYTKMKDKNIIDNTVSTIIIEE